MGPFLAGDPGHFCTGANIRRWIGEFLATGAALVEAGGLLVDKTIDLVDDGEINGTGPFGNPVMDLFDFVGDLFGDNSVHSEPDIVEKEHPHMSKEWAEHILDLHKHGSKIPGKTEFRPDWWDEKILDAIEEVYKTGEELRVSPKGMMTLVYVENTKASR